MKYSFRFFLCLALFTFLGFLGAPKAYATSFDKLDVKIRLNTDGTFAVRERIRFDFDLKEERGIIRKLPLEYIVNGKTRKIQITNINVFDDSENAYPFSLVEGNKEIEIQTGEPEKKVTGRQYYNITYTVNGAVQSFTDHDEWQWNLMGGKWQIKAENVEADVYLPKDVNEVDVRSQCEYGFYMSTDPCSFNFKKGEESLLVEKITFNQSNVLAGEQMLVKIGLPRGIISAPASWGERFQTFLNKNWTQMSFFGGALIILISRFAKREKIKFLVEFFKKIFKKIKKD